LSRIKGDILILGGSGKMGKELVGLLTNADELNKIKRKITVASTFSNPRADDKKNLEKYGVTCLKGDLSDEKFISTLPDAANVFYMMGFKFGSSSDWRKAFHLNSIVPKSISAFRLEGPGMFRESFISAPGNLWLEYSSP
jgi:uncharacterized protein YbjT (DUF2867 family)